MTASLDRAVEAACKAADDEAEQQDFSASMDYGQSESRAIMRAALLAALPHLGVDREWISVAERLPDDGISFLAYCVLDDEPLICTMRLPVLLAKNRARDSKFATYERVTHWMPLPEPPKPTRTDDHAR